jgi:hypothetical protein
MPFSESCNGEQYPPVLQKFSFVQHSNFSYSRNDNKPLTKCLPAFLSLCRRREEEDLYQARISQQLEVFLGKLLRGWLFMCGH